MPRNPQNLYSGKPIGGFKMPEPLSSRDAMRIDNRINPRSVVSWTMTGSSYRNGRRIPGSVCLNLSGGGLLWYAENTPLATAFDDAADRGFDTSEARAKADEWVRTGKGATFSLG